MSRKSMDEKIREYLRRKAEYKEDNNRNPKDLHPVHPDNE